MNYLKLFLTCMLLGGAIAAGGSMVGARFGHTGLVMGGVIGGVIGSILGVRLAVSRGWISESQMTFTSIGAAMGFVLASYVATHTLSSPVGPVLSTTLIGIGAIIGARFAAPRNPA